MKADKIIFPTDFSTTGDSGMAQATALARDSGAKLLIVHVEEPPAAYATGTMYYGVPAPDLEAINQMLTEVVPTDPAVPYEHRLLTGEPAAEIVRLAAEEEADLIVMGTHGRTGLLRLLMGSVVESVVRRAKCPVFTFKSPEEPAS